MKMNRIKLVLVSPLPPPHGGMQTWTQDFIDYFSGSQLLDVRLVNQGLVGKRAASRIGKKNIFAELARSCKILHALKREIKKGGDIVHINSPCSRTGIIRDFLCIKLAHRRGLPVIFHCHCNVEKQIGKSRMGLSYLKKAVSLSDTVLVLNQSSRAYLKQNCGIDSKIVYNFISDKTISADKETGKTLLCAVFVGNVIAKKGICELLRTAAAFPEITFLIVGKKDPDVFEDEASDNVQFTGPVSRERVREYLDSADLFVFPTYTEGFSVALAEAMARGLPVITTDVGANREMIGKGGGIIVDVGDTDGLIAAVEALKDPGVRRGMTEYNLKRVWDFSTDKIMREYLHIYDDVLGEDYHLKS